MSKHKLDLHDLFNKGVQDERVEQPQSTGKT